MHLFSGIVGISCLKRQSGGDPRTVEFSGDKRDATAKFPFFYEIFRLGRCGDGSPALPQPGGRIRAKPRFRAAQESPGPAAPG